MIDKAIRKKWEDKAAKMLQGRTITRARYLSDKEMNELGWCESGLVMQLDDGNIVFLSQDDEGNGPGALFTGIEETPILPVLG